MGAELDIDLDDVAATSAKAKRELEELRAKASRWEAIRRYLVVEDVGEDREILSLLIRGEDLEEDAARAIPEDFDGCLTVENSVDFLAQANPRKRRLPMTKDEAQRIQPGDMVGTAEWNRYASCRATLSNPVKVLAVKRGQYSQTGTMLLVSGYADWIDAGWFEAPAAETASQK